MTKTICKEEEHIAELKEVGNQEVNTIRTGRSEREMQQIKRLKQTL